MYIEKSILKYFKENSNKGLSMFAKIQQWVEAASRSVTEKSIAEYPDCKANHRKLYLMKGRKYHRVVITSLYDYEHSSSSYCFIDNEGNIYKCAGWKKPASGIRGNIETKSPEEVTPSTRWLYVKR